MSCCKDLKSCPCEAKNEQVPKPAPLVPVSADFKGWVVLEPVSHEHGFDTSGVRRFLFMRVSGAHALELS